MSHGKKQEPPEVEQSKDVDLYLLDPKTMTFEEVIAVYEKITGRKSTPEDDENARLFWQQLQAQRTDGARKP